MSTPSEITVIVERIKQELTQIEQEAGEGLNICRAILESFPNNFTVIQLSGFLNTCIFFANTSKTQIQERIEYLSAVEVLTNDRIEEVGEDLAMELGRVLETKIRVSSVKARLENLQ
ncbi:MAG: hypothetical protein JGK04_12445 [Microcoleus sp. PH2017_39_LGB_O_B]|uniref:hypothetical protein n=1 Tax=unclassified Microcoleus TaxID=2642155 RepID=UPI001DC833B7|nr:MULTISPECIES: hypothetical protein [unclassified Microcoleus]TAF91023.1 MAG: hypothetical protein EAZ49_06995 [Oscillatoriales cyanobacterium]MCC3448251.1 hypothetical protein [Microcoleus sp. PH2017_09_SFU_O_A]MCC3587892.1 hypothetical protein [Microcoleus sp. PH2017_30_WIL_O_A]MCC3629222.1 hypothetical protein [Microcoleus sp. PH2017_39_LGB_O_B]MCC3641307.1 hypothetical protein [Microcoleus sp. PH2017_33_LGB_O_A]